jgi:lipoprotein-anchoring transpeptidase ErfK/SrfK
LGWLGVAFAGALVMPAAGSSAAARTPLYWQAAPHSGARIVVGHRPSTLTVRAAAADRRRTVRISLLGTGPARLLTTPGNPAVARLRLAPTARWPRIFSLTLVARASGEPRLAITRTVVVVVRARAVSLVGPGPISRWAYVLHATRARAGAASSGHVVGVVPEATSDGQPNLVRVLAQVRTASGHTWVRVALSALPNGLTGWVERSALSPYRSVATRLVVDTRRLRVTLYAHGRAVFGAPVGVGQPRWPTPRGTFYVREKLTGFHDPFYGPIAFGTNARSRVLTDWPGGGIMGIHGTNQPSLIPGRVSHGCIRLRNADIVRLARILPLGTPVVVR